MGMVASGCGLCDIDRLLFRVGNHASKNLGVFARRKYTNYYPNRKLKVMEGIFLSCQDIPIFRHLIEQL